LEPALSTENNSSNQIKLEYIFSLLKFKPKPLPEIQYCYLFSLVYNIQTHKPEYLFTSLKFKPEPLPGIQAHFARKLQPAYQQKLQYLNNSSSRTNPATIGQPLTQVLNHQPTVQQQRHKQ